MTNSPIPRTRANQRSMPSNTSPVEPGRGDIAGVRRERRGRVADPVDAFPRVLVALDAVFPEAAVLRGAALPLCRRQPSGRCLARCPCGALPCPMLPCGALPPGGSPARRLSRPTGLLASLRFARAHLLSCG